MNAENLEALIQSRKCLTTGLCKLDFLENGICSSGAVSRYWAYYPKGKMAIIQNLHKLPLSPRLVDIARSCSLCTRCSAMCYFEIEQQSVNIIQEFKNRVLKREQTEQLISNPVDSVLEGLKKIVGEYWAENDVAILCSYSTRGFGGLYFTPQRFPRYVVLPKSAEEVSLIVRYLRNYNLSWRPVGNGYTSLYMADVVIDLCRLDDIVISEDSRIVTVGPGVINYQLYKKCSELGLKVIYGMPASCTCANQIANGMLSIFMNRYPTFGNNGTKIKYVSADGSCHEESMPLSKRRLELCTDSGDIVTSLSLKLYPTDQESRGAVIGFKSLREGIHAAKEVALRNGAEGIALFGVPLLCNCLHPVKDVGNIVKSVLMETLDIHYLLLVVGSQSELENLRENYPGRFVHEALFGMMTSSAELLDSDEGKRVLSTVSNETSFQDGINEICLFVIDKQNRPPSESLSVSIPSALKSIFEKYYRRSEVLRSNFIFSTMLDAARSCRMGHFFPALLIAHPEIISDACGALTNLITAVSNEYSTPSEFVFFIPFRNGTLGLIEWDFYVDPTYPIAVRQAKKAFYSMFKRLEEIRKDYPGIVPMEEIDFKGLYDLEEIVTKYSLQRATEPANSTTSDTYNASSLCNS